MKIKGNFFDSVIEISSPYVEEAFSGFIKNFDSYKKKYNLKATRSSQRWVGTITSGLFLEKLVQTYILKKAKSKWGPEIRVELNYILKSGNLSYEFDALVFDKKGRPLEIIEVKKGVKSSYFRKGNKLSIVKKANLLGLKNEKNAEEITYYLLNEPKKFTKQIFDRAERKTGYGINKVCVDAEFPETSTKFSQISWQLWVELVKHPKMSWDEWLDLLRRG